mmetsp:Transcript_8524/g.12913  ORF Transcript_8524/g.12913 Transcript_8524/m.12913 type:complete len:133 (-) Transcript_8524:14-412(-)
MVQGEWQDEKIAVFQSDKGVNFLVSQGKEKGADCHSICTYTTNPIIYPPTSLPLCEFVIISSLQQLSFWTSYTQTQIPNSSTLKQYQQTKVIATSQRILSKAENDNFSCFLSPSHEPLTLLKTIEQARMKEK